MALPSVHDHLQWQAEFRSRIVPPLIHYLQTLLSTAFIKQPPFQIRLYGSLHHGLYISHRSKINLDMAGGCSLS